MRRYIRDQTVELLATVEEGIGQTAMLEPGAAKAVCEDCTLAVRSAERALRAGLSKERFSFYQAYLSSLLQQLGALAGNAAPAGEARRQAQGSTRALRDALAAEQEAKREIVFVPYKASMWDAMESIWEAAAKDERCNVFVVPAPYYDKNPDLSMGRLHYEGNNFPAYVPITHYDEYDFSLTRPDVIYIHNPYDESNYVTTLDTRFYASRLKDQTGMLVYVPYFITMEKVPASLCNLPAVKHSHVVVVPSEQQRERYSRFSGQPLSKFAVLGSPKFDRIVSRGREAYILPEKWKRLIEGKRVVLYNTHLDTIMNYGDMLLKKLSYVFSCLAGRDDVVLWWRPHPLSRSTLSTLRPALYEAYCAAEDWYRDNEIGIFDDTPNLDRAIACTDAYYGDWSSLVNLYAVTGKPVMLQSIWIHKPDAERYFSSLCFDSCDEEGGKLYFTSPLYNALYQADLAGGPARCLGSVPGEAPYLERLFGAVCACGEYLVLLPQTARNPSVYDRKAAAFRNVKLKLVEDVTDKFCQAFSYGGFVFGVPSGYPAIVRLNPGTGEVVYYEECVREAKRHQPKSATSLAEKNGCRVGNMLYIPIYQTNIILEFCMDTGAYKLHRIGDAAVCHHQILFDGARFWLIPANGNRLLRWDRQAGAYEALELPAGEGKPVSWMQAFLRGGMLYLLPYFDGFILALDLRTGGARRIAIAYGGLRVDPAANACTFLYHSALPLADGRLLLNTTSGHDLLFVNLSDGSAEVSRLEIPAEEADAYLKLSWVDRDDTEVLHNIYYEGEALSLAVYLDYTARGAGDERCRFQRDFFRSFYANIDGSAGRKTHAYVLSRLRGKEMEV